MVHIVKTAHKTHVNSDTIWHTGRNFFLGSSIILNDKKNYYNIFTNFATGAYMYTNLKYQFTLICKSMNVTILTQVAKSDSV